VKKILLVDNDRFILEVVKDLLKQQGHEVLTAEDGLCALDVLEGFTPDIIFLDMVMPNIDGKRLCRILRKMGGYRDVYIVSLSATAQEDSGDIARSGVDASIAKGPFKAMAAEILSVLEKASEVPSHVSTEAVTSSVSIYERGITRELLSGMRHFEIILGQMDEGIFEIASNGRVVYANRGASLLMRLSEEEMLGRPFPDLFTGENRKRAMGLLGGGVGSADRVSHDDPLILNGHQVVIDVHPIPDSDGKSIVILHNVTEQKRAEDALKKSEEQYRLLFENSSDAIFVLQDDAVRFPNGRVFEIFGFSPNHLSGLPFFELVHPENRNGVRDHCRRILIGEARSQTTSFRMLNRSDDAVWVELNAVPIRWDGRPALLMFIRDVTEKRRLESNFQQSQRMASIGTLAGGIAHEFNNLLMAIQANTSLILYGKDQKHPDHERLQNIETYVRKGADLIRDLLTFARKERYHPELADVNRLAQRTEELFSRTKKEITLHTHYEPDLPMIEVDIAQMEQVLMCLYINASQAMPYGGEVFIETGVTHLNSDVVQPYGLESGRYVRISIRDTGVGMDARTRERIFEPFFSTKELGKGIGLSLAAAYGIVGNHGGMMDVSSEIGKGSTFSVYLPVSKGATAAKSISGSARGDLP